MLKDITLEDVEIKFANFRGDPEYINHKGESFASRNIHIVVPADKVEALKAEGWNIRKFELALEDFMELLKVSINLHGIPPQLITEKSISKTMDAEVCDVLYRKTKNQPFRASVTIRPYPWEIGDKNGVKAYLLCLDMSK